jgi:hypothetical protein
MNISLTFFGSLTRIIVAQEDIHNNFSLIRVKES